MKSLDTNILLYSINEDCPEHSSCADLVRGALRERDAWIIADQVWFELYRLLRNPAVLEYPLGADQAARTVAWYRNSTGWMHCAWETGMMSQVDGLWSAPRFPARRSFDLILAVTLHRNGVTDFYTRNTRDFLDFGFFSVVNPLV